jgi:hypothetical protein
MTAYELAKKVNEQLTRHNLKKIPPQMVYQYVSKGYIPSYVENGQSLIDNETATLWTQWYVGKRVHTAAATSTK